MSRVADWLSILLIALTTVLGVVGGVGTAVVIPAGVLGALLVLAVARAGSTKDDVLRPVAPVHPDDANGLYLGDILAAGLAVRLVMAFVANSTSLAVEVAPDGLFYAKMGQMIAHSWESAFFDPREIIGFNASSLYQNLNGLAWLVFDGHVTYPMSILNAFVGTAAIWYIGKLAWLLYGGAAARRATLIAALFPSIVLWSSVNIRESWGFLAVSALVYSAQQLRSRFSVKHLVWLAAWLAVTVFIRNYLVPLLALGIVLSYLIIRVRQVPVAAVIIVLLVVGFRAFGEDIGFTEQIFSEESLETMHRMRVGLSMGGSAYGAEADTTTLAGAMAYLPEGIGRFLLSPFPWNIASWRQAIAVPETLWWYVLLYQAVRQIVRDARADLPRAALMVFVPLVITLAYALVEGNEGTAYRHRAQLMLFAFVLASRYQLRGLHDMQPHAPSDGLSSPQSPALRHARS